jgi:hypothetical protein
MKYLLFSFHFLVFCVSPVFCQTKFEKGYFITNEDQRIECLVYNSQWNDNPIEFFYKQGNEKELAIVKISEAKEFGIVGSIKFVREVLDIDQSTDDLSSLGNSRNPIWKKDTAYLKVLVEGKANLYSFQNGNLFRYFYKVEDKEVSQLIYKRFFLSSGVIAENKSFQQQLFNDVRCSSTTIKNATKLDYKENSLIKYFVDYLACNGDISQMNKARDNRTKNITATVGTQLLSGLTSPNYSVIRLGVEFEQMLTNRNNWAFFVDPNLYISSNESLVFLPFGIRHYFHLNNHARLFLNLSLFGPYFSTSYATQLSGFLIFQPFVGGGVAYNRFRIEARIPLSSVPNPASSITVGFRLFSRK